MSVALMFLKKYWKELLLALILTVLIIIIGIQTWQINRRNDEIKDLKASVISLDAAMKAVVESQISMENLMKAQAGILIAIQAKETEAEKVFVEKITHNREIVEKWITAPEDGAAEAAYYSSRDASWSDMFENWEDIK